jgi:ATP-dependent Clp protease ATP-binding subunit ClpA
MRFDFTDRVRKVLAMASEEAIRLGHEHVGTEHLLLGLLREREGVAAAVPTSLSGGPEQIRERIERSVRRGQGTITLSELPYTSRAKRVLEHTMVEARELNHRYVGTEHLLLGLLHEKDGNAAEVLAGFGMTLDRARQETVRLLDTQPEKISTDDKRRGGRPAACWATHRRVRPSRWPFRSESTTHRRSPSTSRSWRRCRRRSPPGRPLPDAERPETLAGLLRPVAVAAFHLGASGDELRTALERAMEGIFRDPDGSSR